jgi:hypothetical protein
MAGLECGRLGGPEGPELFSAFPERGGKPPSYLGGTSSSPSLYVGIFVGAASSSDTTSDKRASKKCRRGDTVLVQNAGAVSPPEGAGGGRKRAARGNHARLARDRLVRHPPSAASGAAAAGTSDARDE